MDFATIKVRFEWFGREADSWGEIGGACQDLAGSLMCVEVRHKESLFESVYEAYESLRGALITSTDGDTGHGYGVGAQVAQRIKTRLLQTSYEYARTEATNAEDAATIEKLIADDVEARR
jgi:hypothetical protein